MCPDIAAAECGSRTRSRGCLLERGLEEGGEKGPANLLAYEKEEKTTFGVCRAGSEKTMRTEYR